MPALRAASLTALLLLCGCAYSYADTLAPNYPPGYDSGMGTGQFLQPGDQFGGQNVASIDVFYTALAPYGRWVDSRYGRGFQPRTAVGWRPYVNGRWGENRLWISDDPWGWATDHYGRWGHDDRVGWVWVPGTQWAPSWVAWRDADQVAGWAPIPPGVSYSVGLGFGSGWGFDNWNSWYGPSWVWVPRSSLYRPRFGGAVLPWNNGYNYWSGSRWNYNPGWNGGWNNGWNGGWNGNRNRGGNRRPDFVRPGTSLPRVAQPGYGRPGDIDRRDRGRPGYSLPDGSTRQPRPDGSQGGNPGRMQRPDGNPRMISADPSAYAPPARGDRPAYIPPPRAERPAYTPAPRADQRPAEPMRAGRERFEQPE